MKIIKITYKVNVALLGNTYRTMATLDSLAKAKECACMWHKEGYPVQIEKIWTV